MLTYCLHSTKIAFQMWVSIEKEKKFKKISDMNIQIRTRFCVTQSLYTYYIPMKYPLHIAFSKAYQFKTFSWQTM